MTGKNTTDLRESSTSSIKSAEAMWWEKTMDAKHFLNLPSIEPLMAAMLLCRFNPLEINVEVAAITTTDETRPQDFERLKQLFQSHYRTDSTKEKTLLEWKKIADDEGYKYHSWIKVYSPLFVSEINQPKEINHRELAYKFDLIRVFGPFTNMDNSWFKKLEGPLLHARKEIGRGGHGCSIEPMFCPYEVLKWLTGTGFKKKNARRINAQKAWELLKKNWPDVYQDHHLESPLQED